jgi:Fic family protein
MKEVCKIERLVGQLEGLQHIKPQPYLRKSNRVRTIQGSLAIEGNTLDLDQVTALLDGQKVLGRKNEIREVLNAIEAYDTIHTFRPHTLKDLLKAHRIMMMGLIKNAGKWRGSGVGILKGTAVSHVAPPASLLPGLMKTLFDFLKNNEVHPLIQSCVFHYELEFIHPFADGNGRIGRFWQSRLLMHYHPVFEFIPVESIVKENQEDYYKALEHSDQTGQSTPFVEFSLSMIGEALADYLDALKPKPLSGTERLEIAKTYFRSKQFSRKDYLKHFKTISTATASRDLKLGVELDWLDKEGERANTVYQYL